MRWLARYRLAVLFVACIVITLPMIGQAVPAAVQPYPVHDGSHDFDFEVGTWNIHLKRLAKRLEGSTQWIEFDGATTTRKILGGRGSIEQFETSSATGHIEGLTLRLYNPQSHQWRLYWANSADGQLAQPMVGEFRNGVGEFYDHEDWNGRMIICRFIWSQITPNSAHFEQAYSEDGGKTWEVNWITDQTRTGPEPDWSQQQENRPSTPLADLASLAPAAVPDGGHDFDFNFGVWKTHIERRVHPLSGSEEWTQLDGTVTVHKLWGGRAQLEEIDASGASGHFQGMTLFLYDPRSRQWSQTFANVDEGILGSPAFGSFSNGRGELFDQEMFRGQSIFVSAVWSQIAPDSHRFEQSFSKDGGKTWEPNFVATLTRLSR